VDLDNHREQWLDLRFVRSKRQAVLFPWKMLWLGTAPSTRLMPAGSLARSAEPDFGRRQRRLCLVQQGGFLASQARNERGNIANETDDDEKISRPGPRR